MFAVVYGLVTGYIVSTYLESFFHDVVQHRPKVNVSVCSLVVCCVVRFIVLLFVYCIV